MPRKRFSPSVCHRLPNLSAFARTFEIRHFNLPEPSIDFPDSGRVRHTTDEFVKKKNIFIHKLKKRCLRWGVYFHHFGVVTAASFGSKCSRVEQTEKRLCNWNEEAVRGGSCVRKGVGGRWSHPLAYYERAFVLFGVGARGGGNAWIIKCLLRLGLTLQVLFFQIEKSVEIQKSILEKEWNHKQKSYWLSWTLEG